MQKLPFQLIFGALACFVFGCHESKKSAVKQPEAMTQPAAPTTNPVAATTAPAQANPTVNPSQKTLSQEKTPANPAAQTTKTAPTKPNPVIPPPTGVNKPTASLGVPTVQKKPLSASKTAFFTEQNWLVTLASGSEPKLFEKAYENRWLIFKNDQTFQIFNDAAPTNKGRWAYDEANDILFLSTDYPYFNNSWKCQVFKKNMLLLGNTDINATGIQIRLFMTNKNPGEVKSDGN